MIEIDYDRLESVIIEIVQGHNDIVLSTCYKNKVTSCSMCFANDDLNFYFLTGIRSTKFKQIEVNNQVALCTSNIQIEGTAEILGSPLSENNKEASKMFRVKNKF